MATSERATKATKATPSGRQAALTPPEPETKGTTTLDEHIDAPSVTAPGDGPADTADPTERAASVPADKAAAARDGHLTVNAVVPVDPDKQLAGVAISSAMAEQGDGGKRKDRVEEYDATKPDGTKVRVRHNLDTGATELV